MQTLGAVAAIVGLLLFLIGAVLMRPDTRGFYLQIAAFFSGALLFGSGVFVAARIYPNLLYVVMPLVAIIWVTGYVLHKKYPLPEPAIHDYDPSL